MDFTIDAKNKPLGRIATEISLILQGKKSGGYHPRFVGTDKVIVQNIQHVRVSGKKELQKVYYRHAGALGHLKVKKYREVKEKDPTWALKHAVNLMLPKNRLRAKRMKRIIFEL